MPNGFAIASPKAMAWSYPVSTPGPAPTGSTGFPTLRLSRPADSRAYLNRAAATVGTGCAAGVEAGTATPAGTAGWGSTGIAYACSR